MHTSSSAHGAATASSSSYSRRSIRWKYEVFLSFRGVDTRNTFTDHLFIALRNAGINTFIDNQLRRGENMQSELDQEIEGSRIAVIVFSKRYAESKWCLRELAKIMRCREDQEGKIVYPIFYDVDPSDVRKQGGGFAEAFRKHERDEDPNEVKQWRKDLKASADLGGRNLKTTADGREGLFIEKIVGDVKGLLKTTYLKEAKHSVGIDFRLQEFSTEYLDVGGSPDVQIIGIWGMGGIGKTTLARAVFSKYHRSFSHQCYLEDVRSKKKEMVSLQEQLLRDILKQPDIKVSSVAEGTKEIGKRLRSMKVLIVVDDIDDADQLDELAIEHESFGPGSRIIVITRDEQVLNILKVDKIYEAQEMTDKEALELLSWHAFGSHCPDKEYIELARDVVDYCAGLPLALKVVGRLLAKKSKSIWKSTLDKLGNILHGKIHETLKISYDGLSDDHMKGVFLDVCIFFVGCDITDVMSILDGCSRYSVESDISTLQDRCLLDIDSEDTLRMHDLIQDMGKEIVQAESVAEPEKRSRLWHCEDVTSVLRNESGTEAIRGLILELPENSDEHSFRTEAFKNMRHLKFLILKYVKVTGSYRHLSKELRLLCWHGFPLEVIPEDFDLRNLVHIDLKYSKLVQVWEDSDRLPEKLKVLTLDHSCNLTQLPDFSKLPNLEELNLEGCKGVSGGYHNLAQLKMLHYLNLRDCNITDDAILENLGRSLCSVRSLILDGNGFNRLPILSGLSQLELLSLNHCTNLQAIPDLPTSLITLEANYCTALELMPDFSEMFNMEELQLKDCRKLKDIPNLDNSLYNMVTIHMEGCTSLTDTFKKSLLVKRNVNAFGGIFLSGNDIPYWLAYAVREDETVQFEVPEIVEVPASIDFMIERAERFLNSSPSIDYIGIGGLAVCIVYSSDHSHCTESLCIHVVNRTQRTHFLIWRIDATVTASHEYYLWLGSLSNRKLNLKGGDKVCVHAEFYGTEDDHKIKVKKTGVDFIEWERNLPSGMEDVDYERVPYESDDDTDEEDYESNDDIDEDYQTIP
ncbi:disease resistance protein RPV1-like [Pyrus x bretschneideri]|uniref:disease resistance protein RPV1-like n=1 Tax=Pyrus x bretschneideri TaxID=225117 RepID=UPI0020302BB2|nr:disease resistance protein RPV1-like [Pyrus x bretschneideri]